LVSSFKKGGPHFARDARVHIAISGGADSMALAHLLVRYGRKIVSREQISLLHINHGWRGAHSDADEAFVRELGRKWKVPVQVEKVAGKPSQKGVSWEAFARTLRKQIFEDVIESDPKAWILTAHHADDLAETVLWRLCTGAGRNQGGGILRIEGQELRPLLGFRKKELVAYLMEEKVEWREDASNLDPRFQRAKMRSSLIPVLEAIFPRAVENLALAAIDAQAPDSSGPGSRLPVGEILAASHSRPARAQIRALEALLGGDESAPSVDLPGGWRIERVSGKTTQRATNWILKKINA